MRFTWGLSGRAWDPPTQSEPAPWSIVFWAGNFLRTDRFQQLCSGCFGGFSNDPSARSKRERDIAGAHLFREDWDDPLSHPDRSPQLKEKIRPPEAFGRYD